MASEITVRQLDPRWIDSLRPLWLALRDHYHAVAPELGPVRSDEDSWARRRADYARWLADEGAFCLVAREGGPMASATRRPDHPWATRW